MPMTWIRFRKDCKAYVESSGKCRIKTSYRYNDECNNEDCPKVSYVKRMDKRYDKLKKKIEKVHKKYSKYDWKDNHLVQNLLDNMIDSLTED